MVRYITFILIILSSVSSHSQQFGKERIKMLEKTVVKVLINGKVNGTGFIINENGLLATCFHVIEPGLKRNPKTMVIEDIRADFSIEFESGEVVEVFIDESFIYDEYWYKKGLIGDFILMAPDKSDRKFEYLKFGSWDNLEEGDFVYTSGYPLGVRERVTTTGLVSTKYKRTIVPKNSELKDSIFKIDAAWLDVASNNGNSGGPVIKLGRKAKKDVVVGLLSSKLLPNGDKFSELSKSFLKEAGNKKLTKDKESKRIKLSVGILYDSAAKNAFGISGAVSIDGIAEKLETRSQ